MKILTILGTRPEIIRLSLIIKKLDLLAGKHIIVHTGQNFTYSLSDVFFRELGIRNPDYVISEKKQTVGEQLSVMFREIEKVLIKEKPDKVLVLGDTNSALGAVIAERLDIPVYHMEAGNRCFDWKVPEEKNRKIIDAVSSFNLPYTPKSRENLMREGVPVQRIFVSGNPIYEVLSFYKESIDNSSILNTCSLEKNNYFLATIHRAENVDDPYHLKEIFEGLNRVADTFGKRMIVSIHPRTKSKLENRTDIRMSSKLEFYEPFGFFDFVNLEKNAFCVLTDSGTVQEECCIFHVPTVTVRKTTERPETVECGSNIVSGLQSEPILSAVKVMAGQPTTWVIPEGYDDPLVSDKVVKYLLGGK
ncbi:UDP-N-acetylglucosamine 2-epimerase (non-hydrolyzing) [Fictibacillus enclensis]|uniref:non-hydrolyzing UDP-N-acetylglucosamine 2-epimerase n=1 Tax=Fictibacillus enclensis TaxID=1017270 RepID=UPI0025A234F7|nr:UDP-N-acetylglucosamine 2-epimerase (non-hydrolyzing) [Fictibacillus enclensis]MDM5337854.1 UDP-N-acetylglucosamine 2-epimerase (non-hydrolyzing) [Fictibacillus enclensis]